MYQIQVRMKKMGKKRNAKIETVQLQLSKKPETVKELIEELVKKGVEEYNARKDEGQLLKHLTKEEVEEKALSGKIAFNVRNGNDAEEEKSIYNALQCYEDGLIRIFADEEELEGLEQTVVCDENTIFTFVRLTMLTGW